MQYVLCGVVWCIESRGNQKYPIWVVSGLLSDTPKLTTGGSHMYALFCQASYKDNKKKPTKEKIVKEEKKSCQRFLENLGYDFFPS